MTNAIITIENWNDLNKEVENIQNHALLGGCCVSNHLYITGEKAIERFLKEYAPNARTEKERDIKTDAKATATIVPYIIVEIYGDSRDERGTVYSGCFYTICNFIEYKGQYYNLYRRYNENTGDISLHNDPFHTELRRYLPYNWEKENPAPNRVGTVTDAKLDAWIKWLDERRAAAQTVYNERTAGVVAFMDRLNQMDPTQFDKFKVGPNDGTLVKNGLEYTFIVEPDGHICEKIKIHYSAHNNLDTFLQMIAGTYKPTEKIY